MKHKNGFTLIEIMIVILIISIATSFVLLKAKPESAHTRALKTRDYIFDLFNLAQQKAILEPAIIGFQLSERGYNFYQYDEQSGWQELNKKPFTSQKLGSDIILKLDVPNQVELDNNSMGAMIIFSPSGDQTAFSLDISTTPKPDLYSIIGNHAGELYKH